MVLDTLDPKTQSIIDNQIKYIRKMSLLTDEQMRIVLTQQVLEHPHLIDNYKDEENKKINNDMINAAKDIKSSPLKLARKVA